ncbi:50S ribosomal protein L13 [Candidatus Riflebacteria bacterium]
MKTTWKKVPQKGDPEHWVAIDAEGQVLGRMATMVASILMGKHRPDYSPNMVCGDFVIVTNCDRVKLTGNKLEDKIYYRHSGWRNGGLKEIKCKDLLKKDSEKVVQLAVKRMLPANKLRKVFLKRLKLFKGPQHEHEAQKPVSMTSD